MRYLFVVDLQKEFAKDRQGKKVYEKCLRFISEHRHEYDAVVATVYKQDMSDFVNMHRFINWKEMQSISDLDFEPDRLITHSSYSIKEYPMVGKYDHVDIIGFDTDACVLNACFDIFNSGCSMRVLVDGCWSSGGKDMHEAALKVMRRQFRKAIDEKTDLD